MMIIIDRDSFSMSRMTLLITVFLVLVNIFNTITTNIPKVKTILNYIEIKVISTQTYLLNIALQTLSQYQRRQKIKNPFSDIH